MYVESTRSGKKSWQPGRTHVSVLAELAIRRETVVRKLTELREVHGLTQERAAGQVGVTVRQWQRWESGKSVPYARNISAIAEHFGINEGEFFDPPEERRPASTPTPFAGPDALAAQLERIEARLDALERIEQRLAEMHGMLVNGEEVIAQLDRVEHALAARTDAVLPGVQELLQEAEAARAEASRQTARTAK